MVRRARVRSATALALGLLLVGTGLAGCSENGASDASEPGAPSAPSASDADDGGPRDDDPGPGDEAATSEARVVLDDVEVTVLLTITTSSAGGDGLTGVDATDPCVGTGVDDAPFGSLVPRSRVELVGPTGTVAGTGALPPPSGAVFDGTDVLRCRWEIDLGTVSDEPSYALLVDGVEVRVIEGPAEEEMVVDLVGTITP
jgi:hypothetical protein